MAATWRRRRYDIVEIPMGPMIDMVFLLLVFFMVTARPNKPEADLGLRLPATVEQDEPTDLPDEQRVEVRSGGEVILNDLPLDGPASRDLPQLTATMIRFRQACDANGTEALVTIAAEDDATHQRIADVMDALAAARITGVTFATETGGEDLR
ncbi:MAG: biopolymer transporter ExbD [Verrucomicrobiae bacterium]|nr:biopolymer transporter ExbD [Verrucomicrobiae bacterium]